MQVHCLSAIFFSPMEQSLLKDANVFFLNGLTQAPSYNPDTMMGEVCMTVSSCVI